MKKLVVTFEAGDFEVGSDGGDLLCWEGGETAQRLVCHDGEDLLSSLTGWISFARIVSLF